MIQKVNHFNVHQFQNDCNYFLIFHMLKWLFTLVLKFLDSIIYNNIYNISWGHVNKLKINLMN
jgi:hypothetical protein